MNSVNLTDNFLIAMPSLEDLYFSHALVYICEHNENGALGIIVNRPIDMTSVSYTHLDVYKRQLYDIFYEEARGHLETLVASYVALEADPTAPTAFDMTRAAHTLGGIAATVGLMPLHHLAVALEHALLRRDSSGRLALSLIHI